MKVLQINSVCGIGSTGRIATGIDQILKENGNESYIAFGRGNALDCSTSIKIGTDIDNYMHVAKTRLLDKHGFGSTRATKQFITKIDEVNPDIIHLQNIHGYYLNIELLFGFLKKRNKPVVWTLHDCWAFTGHCAHFDFINCNKWRNGCEACPQKTEYPSSLLLDNSKLNYLLKKKIFNGIEKLTIVTPSKWLTKLVEKSFFKKYPIETIHNGIDLNIFKSVNSLFKKRHNIEDKFIILGVARWDKRKGLEYFIELSNNLSDLYQVVIVGVTEKQKRQLPRNIIAITQTTNVEELVEIYSAADVFVNPTLEDNFPTVNIEALACGTPVITFKTGGSTESIDENCGIVVLKGDIEKLTNAIAEVRDKGKAFYTKACIRKAKDFYNKNDRFHDYLNLYEVILKV
ncbi:glycosyltransferase [Neobacillus drentensis]|uniref:glycosyltransferase n=1 Tax=Neobacillus drentensis TaxID=220684 RepID=UPI002FFF9C1D